MSDQCLGCNNNKWFSVISVHLSTKRVEVVSWCCGIYELEISFLVVAMEMSVFDFCWVSGRVVWRES